MNLSTKNFPWNPKKIINDLEATTRLGGGGSDQLVTKSEGREGVLTDSDDTTKKNCALYFAFIPFKSGTYKNKTPDNV